MKNTKPFNIPIDLMDRAWRAVKFNAGSCGVDGITLSMYEANLGKNLYKLWNRMTSGSYFPKAVKAVSIPKKQGGERVLGIPSVEDRVAQTVVKLVFEEKVEPYFYKDSYGYRPNKSALDAISVTRQRCWKWDWVIEYDIKWLFDNIDHNLLMKAVKRHTSEKWILLYIARWLEAPIRRLDGTLEERSKGVPQGGVISPLLANLFLHYVLDVWISKNYQGILWCRYSDDGLIHCETEHGARDLLSAVSERFTECGLTLHPDKTRIVYCKDDRRKYEYPNNSFELLGYCFRSRRVRSKYEDKCFSGFNLAVSKSAMEAIYQEISSWKIIRRTSSTLQEIANKINPVLRGWLEYYGRYYVTELYRAFSHFNRVLIKWFMRKYSRLRKRKIRAAETLAKTAKEQNNLFVHWRVGIVGVFA